MSEDRHSFDVRRLPPQFKKRIAMIGECWAWTGVVNGKSGYGQIRWNAYGAYKVHRAVYELLVGPIPEGLTIDHLCFNRMCCNPAHLEAVTNRENILRGNNLCARNARKKHCPKGHDYERNGFINSNGSRECRICSRERKTKWQQWDRWRHKAVRLIKSIGGGVS